MVNAFSVDKMFKRLLDLDGNLYRQLFKIKKKSKNRKTTKNYETLVSVMLY